MGKADIISVQYITYNFNAINSNLKLWNFLLRSKSPVCNGVINVNENGQRLKTFIFAYFD